MKIMKIKYAIFAVFVCILGLVFPMNASAEEASYGLTLQCEAEGTQFSLYRIADYTLNETYTLVEPFAASSSKLKGLDKLNDLDSEGLRTLANTLEEWVEAEDIKPVSTKKVEKESVFWENLSRGLYLITGTQTRDEKYLYTPSPSMVVLPARETTGEWNAHPVIKYNKLEKEELKKEKNLEVIKIWKDSGHKDERPSEITIVLLKNGKQYDSVKLNKKNNWRYKWKDLSADDRWTISEKKIPDDYQVEYARSGSKIYVINHYDEPDKPNKPDKPKLPENPKTPEKPTSPKLPQTGQLWWPVPILAVLGAGFWLIGWSRRRTWYDDEK